MNADRRSEERESAPPNADRCPAPHKNAPVDVNKLLKAENKKKDGGLVDR